MTASIADLLSDAVPDARVLTGNSSDGYAIGAMRPAAVVQVRSAEQVATTLALANERGWAVAPRGGGTMLDLGNPIARLDVVLDLSGIDAVVDYQPDDLTVTVQAGVTIGTINRLLVERGQMLPLDVPLPESATIGGALATNAHGSRRLRYGTARDLVIGMQAALPMSGLARSGGKVVKNVAGFDLAKLHIGGLGTAGVITEVTFKLWPVPAESAGLVAAFDGYQAAHDSARGLVTGQLFPAAVVLVGPASADGLKHRWTGEASRGQWLVAVLLLGVHTAVRRQVRDISDLCTRAGSTEISVLDAAECDRLFSRIRDHGRGVDDPANLILRADVLPSDTARAIRTIEDRSASLGTRGDIIAHAGHGVIRAFWPSAPAHAIPDAIRSIRSELAPFGGLVVERAPEGSLAGVDAWGVEGTDLELMRRLKLAYDASGILNPGRFAGGI